MYVRYCVQICNLLFPSEALVENICAAVVMIHLYYSSCQLLVGHMLSYSITLRATHSNQQIIRRHSRPSTPAACALLCKVHALAPLLLCYPSSPSLHAKPTSLPVAFDICTVSLPSLSPMDSTYGPAAGRIMYIPAGLLMLFFGGFLVKPVLCVISCTLVSHLVYLAALQAGFANISIALLVLLAGLGTFILVLEAFEQGPDFATGAVLGVCVALTFYPAPLLTVLLGAVIFSTAFGLVSALVPKEVGILLTSYGGAYMIFYGMELIDSDVFEDSHLVPAFVKPSSVNMWFSVLSFMVVGLLGCCVQLILFSGQSQSTTSRSHYIDIP